MKLSFLSAVHIPVPKRGLSRLGCEDVLIWGTVALAFLLSILIFWDGYLFYQTILGERERAEITMRPPAVNRAKVEEIIKLLDERQQRFEQMRQSR